MKKKEKVRLIVFTTLLIVSLVGMAFSLQHLLHLRPVPVAAHYLRQRTLLSEEDRKTIPLPAACLNEEVIIDPEELQGKCVRLNAAVPNGSLFYRSVLEDVSAVPDRSHLRLLEGETSYDLYVSEVRVNPNSLRSGMAVDLYLTVNDPPRSGLLLKGARITGCYSREGEVYENEKKAAIEIFTLAVKEKDVAVLNKALLAGKISVAVSKESYEELSSAELGKDSEIMSLLQ